MNQFLQDDRYLNTIGSLLFLANRTRPEIGTSVDILSEYSSNPTELLLRTVKRVFRYLKGTKDFGLVYKKNEDKLRFQVFVDADFAQDEGDRKSRSGYIMMPNKCTVGWSTRKQNSVSV